MGKEDSTPMTAEQAQKYFDRGGDCCPYCESGNIMGDAVKIEEAAAYQQCTCTRCGRTWTDGYHFASVIDEGGNVLHAEPLDDAAKLTRLGRLADTLDDFSKKLDEASDVFTTATNKPRIIIEVSGGLVPAIASDVPLDRLNISVLDYDNLNALDGTPDEVLSDAEREPRDDLRRLRDEAEALPYNDFP